MINSYQLTISKLNKNCLNIGATIDGQKVDCTYNVKTGEWITASVNGVNLFNKWQVEKISDMLKNLYVSLATYTMQLFITQVLLA